MSRKSVHVFLLAVLLILSLAEARNPLQEAYDNIRCELAGYTTKVQVHNCQPRSVKINICQGTCLSASTPTGRNNEQVSMCTCCKQTQTQVVNVELWCKKNSNDPQWHKYHHPIESATECSCTSC